MDDKFLEFLFVSGELNKDDSLNNNEIGSLYATYNAMFPDYPLDNEFFFNSESDQISLLEEAIRTNSPIIKRTK